MSSKSSKSAETERFVDAVRKIVSVPKKEVDRRMAEEKQRRDEAKKRKRPE